MNQQEIAALVETTEARAYASLVASSAASELDATATVVGSATVLRASKVRAPLVLNRTIGLGVGVAAREEDLEEIDALYREKELSYAIELSPRANPPELPGWLRARRIRRTISAAMHYRRTAPLQHSAATVSVDRAETSGRRAIADICTRVFNVPEAIGSAISATADDPAWRHWLAFVDGEPVGAALSFLAGDAAWLGWDAVLPAARGRGVHLALIAERVNDAYRAGCSFATSETAANTPAIADPSFRNYARLGFSFAYERATYVAMRRPTRP
jgi:GNAT superfamily N-acetyltransferase